MGQLTPMLRQYMGIKGENPESILFYRMGDFYEMFFDDAQTASKILGITLTARGTYNGEKIPMCGVPHHAAKSYIAKLVDSGLKVAICEQTEDPKASKGIVKREVVRVVTPGSIVDEGAVDEKSNLFIAAIVEQEQNFGLAHADLSTGEFRVTEVRLFNELQDELKRIDPAEVLVFPDNLNANPEALADFRVEVVENDFLDSARAEAILKEQLGTRSLVGFGCHEMKAGIFAAGIMVHYLRETQKGPPRHIKDIVSYHTGDFMFLDSATCTHLELQKTMRRQSVKGSLFHVIDKTVTPMGSRLLKKWIVYPLIDIDQMRGRLGAVSSLKDDPICREQIMDHLNEVYDLERLRGRIALRRTNARDLLALKTSLMQLPAIKQTLSGSTSVVLSEIALRMDTLQDIVQWVDESIREDPPISIKEGGMILEGYDDQLDHLIRLSRDGKSWISEFAASEQKRTGISTLKVGYNRVFGYYIEISKSNLHLAPPDYIRKQTLVNGERYITEALKEQEQNVLGAEEKRVELELTLFNRICERIALENERIKNTATLIAEIDVYAGLSKTAELNNYSCPEVNEGTGIEILDGRHPVIELSVKDEDFVPNDICLNAHDQQVLMITGPNMAGKSTVLRQVALTVLMAQIGSFVPAAKAVIGIVDRIFTRVGASDDLAKGHSTFMVEMNETANILRHATPRSLVILDEIGRGTSTYDGLSIAWAVAEELHDRADRGIRTLFATHYHELTALEETKRRVKNFNIAVREWNDQIIFLRKLVPGGTSRSYGIQVARIAGLAEKVIKRAGEILDTLEKSDLDNGKRATPGHTLPKGNENDMVQLSLFGSQDQRLRDRILGLNIPTMTPLDALTELNEIQAYVRKNS